MPFALACLAGFFLVVHLATLVVAWARCRPRRLGSSPATPAVTVVRPLCGLEPFSAETIAAAFALDYPAFELLFCVARADDPVAPLVEAAIAAHPAVPARLLVGEDRIGANPKLNNMVKGWRHAAYDLVAFIDANVLVPRHYLHGLVASFRDDTGVVSAPPCGLGPTGFGAHLECAFLNTFELRWQVVVDTFGKGFAQGKTLVYRKADLDRSAMRDLAAEPAEDAATTKMVRRAGKRVRLAPPAPLPLAARSFAQVWARQLRWARLRRATFPLEFLPEILSGTAVPTLFLLAAAHANAMPAGAAAAAYLGLWYAGEIALARACRWPAGWRTPFALVLRDLLFPALWVCAFFGGSVTWNGNVVHVKAQPGDAAADAPSLSA